MKINSHYLEAFLAVAKHRNFSKAASIIGLTQSALSQRVQQLEANLESTLFIREKNNLQLTQMGQKLLQYGQVQEKLEQEFLQGLGSDAAFSGTLRIGAFSSVLRSVIIPALAPFLRKNPNICCEFIKAEMYELPEMLKSSKVDMIILDHHYHNKFLEEIVIGREEYVIIESKQFQCPKNIYLDHGPEDNATESYFQFQGKNPQGFQRSFMGDVYGILDGVKAGFGRAVMSKHLCHDDPHLKILKGYKKYTRDVSLHFYKSDYYPKLFNQVKEILVQESQKFLNV